MAALALGLGFAPSPANAYTMSSTNLAIAAQTSGPAAASSDRPAGMGILRRRIIRTDQLLLSWPFTAVALSDRLKPQDCCFA